jgi:probable phosphoglycerate mutase
VTRRTLYVVRHGETDWNAAGRWQGHTDIPLNDNGRSQARSVAWLLREAGVVAVVTSDLARAHETARIIAGELGVPIAYEDRDLRERGFGAFEGLTREECDRLHPDAWRAWLEERKPPEGAESEHALTARVAAAVDRAAREAPGGAAPALVVTHGGALRAAIGRAMALPPRVVKNGAIWAVTWEAGRGLVEARHTLG